MHTKDGSTVAKPNGGFRRSSKSSTVKYAVVSSTDRIVSPAFPMMTPSTITLHIPTTLELDSETYLQYYSREKTFQLMMPPYAGDPKALDPAEFENGITGECLCGNIKLTLRRRDLFSKRNGHLCYCSNCRKSSGCVASNNMVVDRSSVEISDPKGYLKTYHDSNTGSGLTARRSFCSNCGR